MNKVDIKKLSEEVFNAMECVDKEDQKGFFKSVDKIAEGVITTKPFLEDTLLDMAGYSILGLKYLEEHKDD